ncbi:MAG: hypothetical protein AAF291_02855 [Pseudomonadota bacterium]
MASRSKVPAYQLRRKPPFFRPVPLRTRKDGWSEARQCLFLAELYVTGSVGCAAKSVGMSRNSAYRIRARDEAGSFARAWDAVLTRPGLGRAPGAKVDWRKVTQKALIARVETGLVKPVIYRGQVTSIARKPDNSALFRLLRRCGDGLAPLPDEAAT